MLIKHGTGQITNPDDTGEEPIVRTASQYTEEEWQALLSEGEPEEAEYGGSDVTPPAARR